MDFYVLFFFIALEHLLLIIKIFVAMVIPDRPSWVVEANARADYSKEVIHTKKVAEVLKKKKEKRRSMRTSSGASSGDSDKDHARLRRSINDADTITTARKAAGQEAAREKAKEPRYSLGSAKEKPASHLCVGDHSPPMQSGGWGPPQVACEGGRKLTPRSYIRQVPFGEGAGGGG